ncbi:MAG TPA: copper resistance protein B [Sulfurimonas sp.]|uniref:copper resistance protein B n=1 Tax=Sulfurimonas sp. TaxID=2022749 RepID=UPI002C45DAA5|nr:copper resistance protein B [Sulfurimonas sp.]HUH42172.1 copper resistance protein B [Sulfurimonas sp.]
MKNLLKILLLTVTLSLPLFSAMNDNPLRVTFMAEEFEYQFNDEKSTNWDINAYIGYDLDKIYIYSEGEKPKGAKATSENQLLYSRAIAPYWDIQFGIDYDKAPQADKTWGVIAIQGLAPYFFETRTVILIGEGGNIGLRAEAKYEALITQKLILAPSISLSAYTKDDEKMDIGSGFSNLKLGMRLRYEIIREFAPYIGIEWNNNLGKTDDFSNLNETYVTIGLRVWF